MISFFSWAAIARVVRGQTLSIKEKEYIEAARSIGASPVRIMVLDILPNLIAPVLVLATLAIPTAIVFEATLSFLGVGVQPPAASWGNLLVPGAGLLPDLLVVPDLPGRRSCSSPRWPSTCSVTGCGTRWTRGPSACSRPSASAAAASPGAPSPPPRSEEAS